MPSSTPTQAQCLHILPSPPQCRHPNIGNEPTSAHMTSPEERTQWPQLLCPKERTHEHLLHTERDERQLRLPATLVDFYQERTHYPR